MVLQQRKWITIALITALLLSAVWVLTNWQKSSPILAAEESADKRTISVTGAGEITVEPDVAYLNFGVLAKAKTAEEAQNANAKAFEKVNKMLKEQFKLSDKDIKTVGFYVHPEYNYEERKEPVITGYTATHSIQISYRELDRIGELLDAATKAGVNQVNQVSFATENTKKHEMEAMKAAMENARDKAEVLAAAEGKTIKEVIQISQSSQMGNGPIYSNHSGGYAMAEKADYSQTQINTGEIVITTQVNVTYEF
jgi:uncharacterized protein YggE